MTDQHDEFDTESVSLVAHELKTPVGAAKGFLDLLEHSGPLNDQQQVFMNRVRSSLDQMYTLITSLLDYTRIVSATSLEYSTVDVHTVIEGALDLLKDSAAQRGVTIHLQENPSPVYVPVDVRLFRYVIGNLLSNAVKYNKQGGEVWVTVIEEDDSVQVDVRDNGLGIAESALSRVFDRFYRAVKKNENGKIDGSGLGLAICESIIKLHQGRIWVESVLGEGSTFSFVIPTQLEGKPEPAPALSESNTGTAD